MEKLNVALIGQGFMGRTRVASGCQFFPDAHLLGYEHGFGNHDYDIIKVLAAERRGVNMNEAK